ncbi:IclR family transcriptional regulator [Cupriavidus sp. WKF15]|uniref:IclR family transcriptional regulator n=1 Tax=Cupriavidus sp. WKF15 TaxID=3032282 RepID=UPI0023E31131|nr:IclR family transcriptional regulator [Cupriavidus sp. WKF15]WER45038.1 IclR family transcriptional regulator [Cupriavidus sp. WKF15]
MKQNVAFPFQKCSAAEGEPADDEARALRVLVVLESLACAQHPQTLSQLTQRLRVPKATLMRLLGAMERAGFVTQLPPERGFVPGPRAVGLALQTLKSPPVLRECRAILGSVVAALGETCNLTALHGDQVLYIERVETHEPLRLQLSPGVHVPLHCTASGKLFLSAMNRLEQQRTLKYLPLTANTPRTISDPLLLEAELERVRSRGIGVDNEEFVRGMCAVAVPVREPAAAGGGDGSGRVVAAIACHAPTARKPLEALMRAAPVLERAAREMGSVLCE